MFSRFGWKLTIKISFRFEIFRVYAGGVKEYKLEISAWILYPVIVYRNQGIFRLS